MIRRKSMVKLLMMALAVSFLLCFLVNPSAAFDWKKYKGTTIRVMVAKAPMADMYRKYLPEFEEMTGIKVRYGTGSPVGVWFVAIGTTVPTL